MSHYYSFANLCVRKNPTKLFPNLCENVTAHYDILHIKMFLLRIFRKVEQDVQNNVYVFDTLRVYTQIS